MVTKYRPHCNIYLTHEYYRDGWSRDFDLKPHGETLVNLRKNGMLIRKLEKGLSIYYSGPEAQVAPLRPIARAQRWQFSLVPLTPNFNNYTDLGEASTQLIGKPFMYFSNYGYDAVQGLVPREVDGNNNSLLTRQQNAGLEDVIGLTPLSFSLNTPAGSGLQVSVFKLSPGEAPQKIFPIEGDSTSPVSPRINLANGTQGLHLLLQQGVVNSQQLIYVDEQLYRSSARGIIEIFRQPPVDYQQTINYYVEFFRRSATWKYYVANEVIENSKFFIQLSDNTSSPPSPYPGNITFVPVAEGNLSDAERQNISTFSNLTTTLLRSEIPMPLYENPLKNLTLFKIEEEGDPILLIKNLPNPDVRQVEPNLFIKI